MGKNLSFENIGINGENIKISKWGYYCVISAKANEKSIFENEPNRRRYLNGLCRNKNKMGVSIWAICVMSDKLHIIFGNNRENEIKKLIRSVNAGYALYSKFIMDKVKFEKTLFETMEDEKKLIDCFKYICFLPLNYQSYKWSCLMKYLGLKWEFDDLIDTSVIYSLIKQDELLNEFGIKSRNRL